jgi:hypothetical protein
MPTDSPLLPPHPAAAAAAAAAAGAPPVEDDARLEREGEEEDAAAAAAAGRAGDEDAAATELRRGGIVGEENCSTLYRQLLFWRESTPLEHNTTLGLRADSREIGLGRLERSQVPRSLTKNFEISREGPVARARAAPLALPPASSSPAAAQSSS